MGGVPSCCTPAATAASTAIAIGSAISARILPTTGGPDAVSTSIGVTRTLSGTVNSVPFSAKLSPCVTAAVAAPTIAMSALSSSVPADVRAGLTIAVSAWLIVVVSVTSSEAPVVVGGAASASLSLPALLKVEAPASSHISSSDIAASITAAAGAVVSVSSPGPLAIVGKVAVSGFSMSTLVMASASASSHSCSRVRARSCSA
mmetsp:Transcript_16301/g.42315  ORF Transcript_16301/g.42315 Transcript_16301/m.42315 type:complete len:203 (-) Transcript_16301:93-701(-)